MTTQELSTMSKFKAQSKRMHDLWNDESSRKELIARIREASKKRRKHNEFDIRLADIIGQPYDSEILLHEYCIYKELVSELVKLGFDAQGDDGFYFTTRDDVNQEQFDDIVNDLLDTVILNYIKSYGNLRI